MIGSDEGEKFALGTSEEQRPWQAVYREMIEAATGDAAGSEGIVGHRYVGRSLPRNDVLYKVRGKARYAANISLPNMLHGCFVRSPYPYAKIKRVDVAKARALQGVQCVLTAGEIPEDRLYVGSLTYDTPILAKTIVRYVGEPVVAIAAESLSIALAASQLVEVDYEPMVPIATPEEASPLTCKHKVATLRRHWLQRISSSRAPTKTLQSSIVIWKHRQACRSSTTTY
jgi:xanthine dehydrogenase molybdopterin-binding subunit B